MSDILDQVPTKLLIGGEWRDASDGGELDVINPADEEVIARVAAGTKEDGLAAVEAAQQAMPEWAAKSPRERAEVLRSAFALMMARADDIAELMTLENGKALKDAKAEASYAAEFFRWYSEEAVRNISEISTSPAGANRILVIQQPVGVSCLVTPWNFPAAMATRKIGPALAAGCPVILKPASETPLTALLVGEIMLEAGVTPGAVNVLPAGKTGEVVSAMLHDPRVRALSFTGSTSVGSILLGEAADQIINCSMELGGNMPFLVFADADIDDAVDGAMMAKMRNGGEACTAANRFYVEEPIADEFTEKFAERMASLKVGPGLEDDVDLGPLVNAGAQEDMEKFVKDAVDKGAEIVTGGNRLNRKGYFFQPTVLKNVSEDADCVRNEIFGPIAPIMTFDDTEDVIRRANDTEYGLLSCLYTTDLAKGLKVAERLEAGMIGLNRGVVSDPAAPFGGVKQSGVGREGAHEGMLEFLEKKYIAVTW